MAPGIPSRARLWQPRAIKPTGIRSFRPLTTPRMVPSFLPREFLSRYAGQFGSSLPTRKPNACPSERWSWPVPSSLLFSPDRDFAHGQCHSRFKPRVSALSNKIIIIQMRIGAIDPLNFCSLPGAKRFVGIQAPDTFQETLPPQDFMQSCNAAGETVCRVEERGIAIGHFHVPLQQASWNRPVPACRRVAFFQQIDRTFRPHRPVAQQTTDYPAFLQLTANPEDIRRDKIHHDVVVIARIKGDAAP